MSARFLTAQEVASTFFEGKVNYMKVLRLTRKGVIPAIKLGKSYLYKQDELEAWAGKNFSTVAWAKIK